MNDLPGEKLSILLVDDEPSVRRLLFDILSTQYRCQIAESAEAALEALQTQQFSLVISDINLGGMSGVELIPHVQRVSPDTVVMMISGSGTLDTAVEAMRSGSFDYLKKPFQLAHVLAAVQRAIEHQSLLAGKREYEQNLERMVDERTARMKYLEYHDVLTDLPNKVLLEDRLEQLILGCANEAQIAVMLVLIDRLRSVRDVVGDSFADHILLEGVQRFYECAGRSTTVGRLDSSVLAALLPDAVPENVIRLAENLNERIGSSFTVEGENFYVEGKIGVSLFPADGATAAELLKNARAALSRARDLSGPTVQFFTNEITRSATERLALENDLRLAIEREELAVHYQPKVDIGSGQITGVEGLVRWHHAVRGNISPVEFIPIAEETGLIRQIGEFVLRRSCLDLGKLPGLKLAVNLSRTQLQQESLSDRIAEILSETEYHPTRLNLEITESSIMQNEDAAVRLLTGFREFGIQISIDDFGTGYSSLSSLIQLPIDVLKIDRSFMRNAVENEDDASLVKAIVELGHTLRLKVVAEGVETPEQLELLRALGCDEYQGFWFSRPLPIEELEAKLSESRKTHE